MKMFNVIIAVIILAVANVCSAQPEIPFLLDKSSNGEKDQWESIVPTLGEDDQWIVNISSVDIEYDRDWVGAWTKIKRTGTGQETYIIWDCRYNNVGFAAIKVIEEKTGKSKIITDEEVLWIPYFASDGNIMAIGSNYICDAYNQAKSTAERNKK